MASISISLLRLGLSPLVTRTVTLDDLPDTFQALSDPRDCKVVLTFEQ
jgi:threonine dehydrogenase-like Zn-dependent dehydrogenase